MKISMIHCHRWLPSLFFSLGENKTIPKNIFSFTQSKIKKNNNKEIKTWITKAFSTSRQDWEACFQLLVLLLVLLLVSYYSSKKLSCWYPSWKISISIVYNIGFSLLLKGLCVNEDFYDLSTHIVTFYLLIKKWHFWKENKMRNYDMKIHPDPCRDDENNPT